jgi:hypothetical protein
LCALEDPCSLLVMRHLAALLLLAMTACGQTSPAARCPDSVSMPCATGLECDYDKTRMCNACRCAPPPFVTPGQQQK